MKNLSFFVVLTAFALISFSFKDKTPATKKSKASKALAFPVAGKKSKIGGFWGDYRNGGRSHKGIDIFAKKGTPVVAISDGVVVDRGQGGRGGKVLWLQSTDHPWRAYYAHLDKQLVKDGQYVRKGQVIGTVGKTGNAATTPSHLHFGIYKSGMRPVNPLPYVKKATKVAAPKYTKSKKSTPKKSVR